jgi:inosine-uridine nucleoside N-ribohydrolase
MCGESMTDKGWCRWLLVAFTLIGWLGELAAPNSCRALEFSESSSRQPHAGRHVCSLQGELDDPPAIIFDTDMGSDCDDAGALAVAHVLADKGEIRLLGVIFSSGKNRFGAGVCDAINTYFGRGDLPLGQYSGTDVGDPGDRYSRQIAIDKQIYPHDIVNQAPDLVSVYKQLLRREPDQSVTIVTVGHPHGLVHLLRDQEGSQLVSRKVERWVAMGGLWNFGQCGVDQYMEELLQRWSKPMYVSLAGADIKTGHRKLPATRATHPVRSVYKLWDEAVLKSGRPSWDQLAVLFVARPELFQVQTKGRHVRRKPKEVVWDTEVDQPLHFLIVPDRPNEELAVTIEELMTTPPQSAQSRKGDTLR